MAVSNLSTRYRLPAYAAFALLAVLIVGLHSAHFAARPYRQDEAWIVFGALEKSSLQAIIQWVAVNIHPPLWVATADWWVDTFGQQERVTRILSTLFTLLTLAMVFRLGSDLFDYRVGLAAVFLLAAFPFFEFYSHEFRPYPALITCTVGLQLAFVRWLRRPDFRHALILVLAGVAALYVHFFAFYVLGALAVFFVLFVRWNRVLYLRAFGLFLAIAVSYAGWLLPFLHAVLLTNPGGIYYALDSSWKTLGLLYRLMSPRPLPLGALLLIAALLTPMRRLKREQTVQDSGLFRVSSWHKWYALVGPTLILALAFLANHYVPNMTQRTLVIILPSLAIFLAFGMVALPFPAQAALVLLMVPQMLGFVDYEVTGPQAEVAAFIAQDYQVGSPVIVNLPIVPRQVAALYYIQQRMGIQVPNDRVWQVLEPRQPYLDFMPYPPFNVMNDTSSRTLERLKAFIGDAQRVWYVDRSGGTRFSDSILNLLKADYDIVQSRDWPKEFTALEFRRKADHQ